MGEHVCARRLESIVIYGHALDRMSPVGLTTQMKGRDTASVDQHEGCGKLCTLSARRWMRCRSRGPRGILRETSAMEVRKAAPHKLLALVAPAA